MNRRPVRILLVDASRSSLILARALLSECTQWCFEIDGCADLVTLESVHLPVLDHYDAVLFGLPPDDDGSDLRLLRRLCSALGQRPFVLCHEFFDAVRLGGLAEAGVQTVLPKSLWSAESLSHMLMFAIEQAHCRRVYGHDVLTGLPARSVWLDRLMHALDRCRRSNTLFAVMLVDLDDFKHVNDSLGHDAGDQLLHHIAQRLRHSVRPNDTVARLGGDEFAVLIEDLPYPDVALQVARKLIADVCVPAQLARATVPVSISVGVAIMSPQQRQLTRDWAHQAADAALYAAKRAGKRNFSVYTEDMDRALLASLQLDEDVARAVQRDEFSLHYQPLLGLRGGVLIGFEALLRWEHGPRQGMTPDLFVPVLERLGLIDQVGEAIFREALLQLRRARERTRCPLSIHINLSAAQVISADLSRMVLEALDQAGVPADALVIELAESVVSRHVRRIEADLLPLRQRGVRFAVAEFGMGGQSMTYLRQFKPDYIKIDRRLVRQMADSPVDAAIVRAQVTLARELGILLMAEGIERDHDLAALRELGQVEVAQGYLIGSPMMTDAIESYSPYTALLRNPRRNLPERKAPGSARVLSVGRLRTSVTPS
jgi:diguanylate cyclase (GGDEF)-like protein